MENHNIDIKFLRSLSTSKREHESPNGSKMENRQVNKIKESLALGIKNSIFAKNPKENMRIFDNSNHVYDTYGRVIRLDSNLGKQGNMTRKGKFNSKGFCLQIPADTSSPPAT